MTPAIPARSELKRLLGVAMPLIAAYLAEYAMFVTTKLVVGGLGYKHLAAVGLGGSMAHEVLVILMGVLSITGVLAAQAEGAGDKPTAGQAARQGLIVATVLGVIMTVYVWNLDHILALTGQDEEVLALIGPYARAVAFFALPALWFAALRDFIAALSRTRPVMYITVGAVGLNWLIAEALVYGRWGMPELGVAGAGVATAAVNWLMVIALFAYVWRTPALRGYGLFKSRLRVVWPVIKEITYLGLPVAGLVLVEAGMFMAVGLLTGVISAEALAAHQVLMGWIGLPFVIGLAIAEGTMVRTAYGVGRRDMAGARQAGMIGMTFGAGLIMLTVAVPLLAAREFVTIFISVSDPGFEDVAAIVVVLMSIAAVFQVFDALQVIAARSLRAVKDAYFPLWIGAFGYWVLGIGGGWLLAFPFGLGVTGLWFGLAAGLIVSACLLAWRFRAVTRRLILRSQTR